jgi:NAD dependent epimerase/dehydratase family enzyme
MVGRHLVEALLARGDRVIALVRQPSVQHFPSAVEVRGWQASDPVAPVDGADAVVNLVGDPIFARPWSQARKEVLTQTRVLASGPVREPS